MKSIACHIILENGDVINQEDSSSKLNAIYSEILKDDYLEGRFIYYSRDGQQELIEASLDMFIIDIAFEIPCQLILNNRSTVPVYGYGDILFECRNDLVTMSGEHMKKLTFSRNAFLKDSVDCGKVYLDLLIQLHKQYGIYEAAIDYTAEKLKETEVLLFKAGII